MSRVFCAWLLVGLFVLPAAARYGGGQGTAEQPYLISTAAHLNTLGATPSDWDKCFKQTANIDLRDLGSTPFKKIGTLENGVFAGVFDGNYKTISDFRLVSDGDCYVGMFAIVQGEGARIANVTLLNPTVTDEDGQYVGALVGYLSKSTITNCHIRGGSIHSGRMVGGLVGNSNGGAITSCTVAATVCGVSSVGGLIGRLSSGYVTQCQAVGEVQGEDSSSVVGGLVGESSYGNVTACRACSDVQGTDRVGGLVGESFLGLETRCYTEGTVRGTSNVGGLVGQNTGGRTTDCYALVTVTGTTHTGGLVGYNAPTCDCIIYTASSVLRSYAAGPIKGSDRGGITALNYRSSVESSFWDIQGTGCATSDGGTGKTTLQMASRVLYLNEGWDFAGETANGTKDYWRMPVPVGYPRLAWELALGDFNSDGRVDFRDFAVLAKRWRQVDNASIDGGQFVAPDGIVGLDDLTGLADLWLAHRW
jgi:hypothetical protein